MLEKILILRDCDEETGDLSGRSLRIMPATDIDMIYFETYRGRNGDDDHCCTIGAPLNDFWELVEELGGKGPEGGKA